MNEIENILAIMRSEAKAAAEADFAAERAEMQATVQAHIATAQKAEARVKEEVAKRDEMRHRLMNVAAELDTYVESLMAALK